MFNPFIRFEQRFIDAFRKSKERYLVSQVYERAIEKFEDKRKVGLLLTKYSDLNQATVHFQAIKEDKYAAIIDLEKEVHRNKIIDLVSAQSKYVVFSNLVGEISATEKMLTKKYADSIKRYITRFTNWRIGSDKTIYPKMDIVFGELFVTLNYNNEKIRIKLAELEKI
jgi:hypothetical protein